MQPFGHFGHAEGESVSLHDDRREGQPQPRLPAAGDTPREVPSQIDAALPAAVRMLLIGAIQADATDDYAIHPQDDSYVAANPAQHLALQFTPAGVVIRPEDHPLGASPWTMQLLGYGADAAPEAPVPAERVVSGNRIEYRRGQMTEWYVNGPLGLEQGFTLHQAPPKSDPDALLALDLTCHPAWQPALDADHQSVVFSQAEAPTGLRYGQLFVKDAADRMLPVHLELTPGEDQDNHQVRIRVDDRQAVYPLVIDPLVQQQQAKVSASDGAACNLFGESVAVYGDTLVVGAYGADLPGKVDAGAVYVFTRSGSTWSQQAKLTASDSAAGDLFGNSVTIYGDTIAVGSSAADLPGKGDAGAVYVFTRSGSTWSQQAKITSSDIATSDFFGIRCALYGDTLVVSATSADLPGKVDAGAAYVFVRSGSTWSQQAKLTASDAAADDQFGIAVDLVGDIAVVSAPGADLPGKANAGAAYIFQRTGTTWTQTDKITASDAAASDAFGYCIALHGSTVVVGAPTNDVYNNTTLINRAGSAYVFTLVNPSAPPNSGGPDSSLSWAGEVHQDSALNLRTGEKVETATDLAVYSLVGPLDFTRTYRQNKRSAFQFMGLGWQHNHAVALTRITGSPNKIVIQMPNGGELNLSETIPASNVYLADAGSDALVTYSPATTQYTLTGSDKGQYIFNAAGKLVQRLWPPFGATAANWVYTYDANGRLTAVEDKLDSTTLSGRKLVFAYRSNPGQFDDGQLWRIGDQDTANLSGTPVGRYVQFNYTPQKSNGTAIANAKALLNSVRDVRGNTWTYRYFGQTAGETDPNKLDFLVEILSPSVDTSGDGAPDGSLSLESLAYTVSGSNITNLTRNQGNNALSTAYAFQPGGQNTTTETVAGKTGTHAFNNGVYGGFTDPGGNADNQALNFQYRPQTVKDANNQQTQLSWSADGKFLQSLIDALGNTTVYGYNVSGLSADTVNFIQDAEGRKTQYSYADSANPLLPTAIQVLDTNGTTVLRWQSFSYDNKGRLLSAKLLDPANGTTVLQQLDRAYLATPGNGYGLLQTETLVDPLNAANNSTTTFTYDSKGRVVKTQKTSLFGCCQFRYIVYDDADLVVAVVNSRLSQTIPTTKAAAVALFYSADPDKNRITTYDYDTLGRKVLTTAFDGASFAVKEITVYDALGRVIRTIGNYVASGSIPQPYTAARNLFAHGSNADQNRVTDFAYNARGWLRQQTDPLDLVTLYGYDDAGRLVKTIQNASNPTYNNDYSGTAPDPTLASYSPVSDADRDLVASRAYDKAGNLVKTVDPAGQVSYLVYDALNRPIKSVRAAKDAATVSLNPGDAGYNAANDPRSASYSPATDVDRDLIDTTEYDKMGRVIRTQRLLDNRPTAQWETTLYGFDGLGRSVKVVRFANTPAYNVAADPTLAGYSASASTDVDVITRTAYDKAERVLYTEDPFGSKTWVGYDGLGRPIKTIVNAVGTATDGSANDPRSSSYVPSSQPDKDLVLTTTYNADGRVLSAQDALGRVTRSVYDTVGRVIRTIQNFVDQGEDPALWVYNNGWKKSDGTTAISHGSNNDQNQITRTVYDGKGRPVQTIDHRNVTSLLIYDGLDRPIKTVVSYMTQGSSDPANWVWSSANARWEDGAGNAIAFGTNMDRNRITSLTYDLLGRLLRTRTPDGVETRFTLDLLGRRTQSILNYNDGIYNANAPDTDVITTTVYAKSGQVASITDARGTQTAFDRDGVYRPQRVTRAAGSSLATVDFTAYDKAGRVLRLVQNWSNPAGQSWPHLLDGSGNWAWIPADNGGHHDRDLTLHTLFDKASRPTRRIVNYRAQGSSQPANWVWSSANNRWEDGAGNPIAHGTHTDQNLIALTAYDKDGQVESVTDAGGVITRSRYDLLRRKTRLIQGFVDQGEDPALWVWDATDNRWEKSGGAAIAHGSANDQNLVQLMTFDKGGRLLNQRDPRGNVTTYTYDLLNRRKSLTNPLGKVWSHDYIDYVNGGTRRDTTYPGISGAPNYTVQQVIDRLDRVYQTTYGSPATTPSFKVFYDAAGNRQKVSEYTGGSYTNLSRETCFTYDALHRPTAIDIDRDANGSIDETVSYAYDAGGLRTRLTLPGNLNVTYSYDARGQLVSLTDWDNQPTQLVYDNAGRHIATERANRARSRYRYDAAGRLKQLRHSLDHRTLAHFDYQVDRRGNRIRALELLTHPTTTSTTTLAYNNKGLLLDGSWSEVGGYKETTQSSARLKLFFLGDEATLSMGQGPDHGLYDVYVGGTLWQSFDGYAASAGQRDIVISLGIDGRKLPSDGPHLLEIRCRPEKQAASSGTKVRFKQLAVSNRTWSQHTVSYTYDALARILEARYNPGINTAAPDADLLRRYQYTFDRAHNRLSESLALNGGTPTLKTFTYNAANQISSAGYAYDDNGNLTSDGTNAYTWDRANRLLAMGGSAYQHDALGHRIQQTVGGNVTRYLNDLGGGLPTVLSETSGANVTRFLHGPRGLHQIQTPAGVWQHAFADALGSLRLVTDSAAAVLDSRSYGIYGDLFGQAGSAQTGYGYSGEPTDANGLVYDRARYFSPALGQFPSLDPLEVFNRYAYVNGNPVMQTDPSGMLILMSETGGVAAKPVVKTTPVRPWAQNANPNPQPTLAAQNANPNPQPYTLPRTTTITPANTSNYAPGARFSSGTTVTKPTVSPSPQQLNVSITNPSVRGIPDISQQEPERVPTAPPPSNSSPTRESAKSKSEPTPTPTAQANPTAYFYGTLPNNSPYGGVPYENSWGRIDPASYEVLNAITKLLSNLGDPDFLADVSATSGLLSVALLGAALVAAPFSGGTSLLLVAAAKGAGYVSTVTSVAAAEKYAEQGRFGEGIIELVGNFVQLKEFSQVPFADEAVNEFFNQLAGYVYDVLTGYPKANELGNTECPIYIPCQ
ncbi:MAG: hypothetical protein JNM70_01165 [Anaerolineae bacterium]|nr:hypothetical protein [Anaerolineae bacterium]